MEGRAQVSTDGEVMITIGHIIYGAFNTQLIFFRAVEVDVQAIPFIYAALSF